MGSGTRSRRRSEVVRGRRMVVAVHVEFGQAGEIEGMSEWAIQVNTVSKKLALVLRDD